MTELFAVWNIRKNGWALDGHGHFKVYATWSAAQRKAYGFNGPQLTYGKQYKVVPVNVARTK